MNKELRSITRSINGLLNHSKTSGGLKHLQRSTKNNYIVSFLNRSLSFCSPTHVFVRKLQSSNFIKTHKNAKQKWKGSSENSLRNFLHVLCCDEVVYLFLINLCLPPLFSIARGSTPLKMSFFHNHKKPTIKRFSSNEDVSILIYTNLRQTDILYKFPLQEQTF